MRSKKTSPATVAAKQATNTIPIVFAGLADPVAIGVVESLGRPGGNVTGTSLLQTELGTKRLQFLATVVPGLASVAVVYDPNNAAVPPQRSEIKLAASTIGVRVHFVAASTPNEIETAFADGAAAQASAVMMLSDAMFNSSADRFAALALRYRLPLIGTAGQYTEAGALMSYGPNIAYAYFRAAYYVDRVLTGTKPADLPVEQPTKFDFIINLNTARELGITIPTHLLLTATEVIE